MSFKSLAIFSTTLIVAIIHPMAHATDNKTSIPEVSVSEIQAFLDKEVDYTEVDRIEAISGSGETNIEAIIATGTTNPQPAVETIVSLDELFKDNQDESVSTFTGNLIDETLPKVSSLSPIIREKTEVIGTYFLGKKSYPIYSLAKWKFDIMEDMGMPDAQKLHYLIINSLECGRDDGFCRSRADSGFFQINQIHRGDFAKSNRLIAEKKSDELYRFQLQWTLSRLESYKKRLCNQGDTNTIFRCMMKVHNGNNKIIGGGGYRFKDYYAEKGMALKWALLNTVEKGVEEKNMVIAKHP